MIGSGPRAGADIFQAPCFCERRARRKGCAIGCGEIRDELRLITNCGLRIRNRLTEQQAHDQNHANHFSLEQGELLGSAFPYNFRNPCTLIMSQSRAFYIKINAMQSDNINAKIRINLL